MKMFTMRRVKNGAVLEIQEICNGETRKEEIVYQEPHDDHEFEQNEVEAFAAFLREIDCEYGPSTSRYSPKRIRVITEPGDKHENYPNES